MTLYLKYRSQTLSELDQESVRETLTKIVGGGDIPHAFLFAGPKGTGKTSSARILAKIINCENPKKDGEPCNHCEQCKSITKGSNLDVVELDAASHRGIDDVRALRDAVKLAPAAAKKKVYIIDEAHMLTTEASNALLKTLEEPPSHVIFILATTNPEKLIETIKSRTTLVNFKKATEKEIVRALSRIVEGEKIKVEASVLSIIAKRADGSFRDAVKLLENLIAQGKLEPEEIEKSLSGSDINLASLIKFISDKDAKRALEVIGLFSNSGGSVSGLVDQLILRLREDLINIAVNIDTKSVFAESELILLLKKLIKAKSRMVYSPIETLPLEIAIIEFSEGKKISSLQPETKESESSISKKIVSHTKREVKVETKVEAKPETSSSAELKVSSVEVQSDLKLSDEIWKKILIQIKPINASVEALLRSSRPKSFDGHTLKLDVFYKFHKERLEDMRHRKILEDVVAEVTGSDIVKVVCSLTEPPVSKIEEIKTEAVLTEGSDPDIIDVAEKIFNS